MITCTQLRSPPTSTTVETSGLKPLVFCEKSCMLLRKEEEASKGRKNIALLLFSRLPIEETLIRQYNYNCI